MQDFFHQHYHTRILWFHILNLECLSQTLRVAVAEKSQPGSPCEILYSSRRFFWICCGYNSSVPKPLLICPVTTKSTGFYMVLFGYMFVPQNHFNWMGNKQFSYFLKLGFLDVSGQTDHFRGRTCPMSKRLATSSLPQLHHPQTNTWNPDVLWTACNCSKRRFGYMILNNFTLW